MGKFKDVISVGHIVSTVLTFAVIGLILVGFGAFIMSTTVNTAVLPTVDAVITDISSAPDDDEIPLVTVEYTVDGNTYTSTLNSYSSTYEVGQTLSVKYDPDNPLRVYTEMSCIGYILIAVGAVCLIGAAVYLFRSVRRFRKEKADIRSWKENASADSPTDAGARNGKAAFSDESAFPRKLYFHIQMNTVKPSCFLEDETGRLLYEAKVTKFAMLGDDQYDFINYETGKTQQRSIGKTVTTAANSIFSDISFTVDGIDINDILHRNGVDTDMDFHGSSIVPMPTFYVSRYAKPYAIIDISGPNAHSGQGNGRGIPVNGFYDVQTNAAELDLLFLILFAMSRSTR